MNKDTVLTRRHLSVISPRDKKRPLCSPSQGRMLTMGNRVCGRQRVHAQCTKGCSFRAKDSYRIVLTLCGSGNVRFLRSVDKVFTFILCSRRGSRFLVTHSPVNIVPLCVNESGSKGVCFNDRLGTLRKFYSRCRLFLPKRCCCDGRKRVGH